MTIEVIVSHCLLWIDKYTQVKVCYVFVELCVGAHVIVFLIQAIMIIAARAAAF